MNFYLAAVDDTLKHPSDQPSIGLILCKSKTEVVVEYALRGTTTPMGISEFTHFCETPEEFKGSLPDYCKRLKRSCPLSAEEPSKEH